MPLNATEAPTVNLTNTTVVVARRQELKYSLDNVRKEINRSLK